MPNLKKQNLKKIIELADDLYWDFDRLSSSGQETLDKLTKRLDKLNRGDWTDENICSEFSRI